MWRGGCRSDISVSAPFVWRCLSGSTMTPFPTSRSSNRTCRFPASGSPIGFIACHPASGPTPAYHTARVPGARVGGATRLRFCLSLAIKLPLKDSDLFRCCQAHRQSPDPLRLRKRSKSRGPSGFPLARAPHGLEASLSRWMYRTPTRPLLPRSRPQLKCTHSSPLPGAIVATTAVAKSHEIVGSHCPTSNETFSDQPYGTPGALG